MSAPTDGNFLAILKFSVLFGFLSIINNVMLAGSADFHGKMI